MNVTKTVAVTEASWRHTMLNGFAEIIQQITPNTKLPRSGFIKIQYELFGNGARKNKAPRVRLTGTHQFTDPQTVSDDL